MSPRVDELLEAAINAYEDVIRRTCDVQLGLARAVPYAPARSLLYITADLTRDLGAVQLSGARWLLDA